MASTSSQVFPTLPGALDASHSTTDGTLAVASCTDWYTPGTYAYDSYMTPYPSSTVESQPWYPRTTAPTLFNPIFPQSGTSLQTQHPIAQIRDQSRPRSSPSSFRPAAESIVWTSTNALGIQYSTAGESTAATSTFPPNVFHAYPIDENYTTSSPPEIRQPQPRKPYTSIAPNPAGLVAAKRLREDDNADDSSSSSVLKRRKRTSSVASADLNDDDRFLVRLKEDENLPWKDIAARFLSDKGKVFQVAALQMRYKRLREKFRTWQDEDVQALRQAVQYWEKYKWDIISSKMTEFGVQERWPARLCARKWQALESAQPTYLSTTTVTSASQLSSPTEPLYHFAYMPMQ
ncbi:Hypothetical protein R9X50_00169700 [Acrodontium crateriforme]|uniref:Myb-like domain-containing protein n=1 Tax=Acrodontium crateriforme TaxID=150365 RepID=A0AAQ3M2H1_9PEZI|nr:Hypothetical protein R9X50_00169700 [Acrodontium crateriforme]